EQPSLEIRPRAVLVVPEGRCIRHVEVGPVGIVVAARVAYYCALRGELRGAARHIPDRPERSVSGHGEGVSALQYSQAAEAPSAEHPADQGPGVGQFWQIDQEVERQLLVNIVVAQRSLSAHIIRIDDGSGHGSRSRSSAIDQVNGFPQRVRGLEIDSMAE